MSRKKITLSTIFLLLISFLFVGNTTVSAEENNTISNGVFIDSVDVSGLTRSEAEGAVEHFVDGLRSRGVAIIIGENAVYTTMGDLEYAYEPNDNIKQALNLGTAGNLIKRYKDLKDIEQEGVTYPLTFTYDENKLKDLISLEVGAYNIAPVNATLTRKNNKFVYTDHKLGSKVDVDQTTELISNAIFNNWNRLDIVVNAVMIDDMPEYTREYVEKCNTVIGTFKTEYTSSAEGRAANLANGARLINNTVIYPGEIFSGYEYMHPFTAQNGYYVAGAYLKGKIIDSVGGGACQVTTTLYNAVLEAELEVVQRNEHSMTISYADLSRDAAIAGTTKDLKFANSSDAPILIEATTVDREITFTIWGHETRDKSNREVKYETVVHSETAPPPEKITEDPTLPEGTRKVTQSAHTGYTAELYKIVYENGVEVSRTWVNKSRYAAAPKYVTIGTMKVEEEEEQEEDPEVTADIEEEEEEPFLDEPNESQSTSQLNRTNPEAQRQGDIWNQQMEQEDFDGE